MRTPAYRTWLILLACACGMACLLALLPAAGHDQMWLLYAANLHLHGAPLYGPQIFETNPPMILWLSMLPNLLANATHLPATAWGKLLVSLLELAIAMLCWRLIKPLHPALSRGAMAGLAFAYICVFSVLPARDFGQRDYLLILLVLPYVAAAARRAAGVAIAGALAWSVGVLALMGYVLKPHQLVVLFAIEIWLLLKGRRPSFLRPEIFGLILAGFVFLASIKLFAPLYFSMLPLLRNTYWAYGQLTLFQLLGQSIQLHVLLVIHIALIASLGWRRLKPVASTLVIAGIASTLAYYMQGTGWYYQQLPALSLLTLALAFLLVELADVRDWSMPAWTPRTAAGLSLLALALTTHFMRYPFTAERSFPLDTPDPGFFRNLPAGAAVMTISPTVDDTMQPIFKYHLTLGERYPAFLLLPAILRSEDPQGGPLRHRIPTDQLAQLKRTQYEIMREDMERWHPALLLVERCEDPTVHCQTLEERHDNLLGFFLRDPGFAIIFSRYRFLRSAGTYDAYVPR